MQDVNQVLGRIAMALAASRAALDRIPTGAATPLADPAASSALEIALDEERTANTQLAERLRQSRSRSEARITTLEGDLERARGQVAELDAAVQSLRAVGGDMRDQVAGLRAAISRGVAEPGMINRALLAEVEALAALRAADRAEVDAIVAELKPLVGEGA